MDSNEGFGVEARIGVGGEGSCFCCTHLAFPTEQPRLVLHQSSKEKEIHGKRRSMGSEENVG